MASSSDPASEPPRARPALRGLVPLEELARGKNVRTIESAEALARDGIFDTDEELDAFLAHVAAMRHADLA